MYSVSNDYKAALKSPAHKWKLSGTIGSTPITEANILQGSMSVVKQCSEGSEVKIGSVYISELKATLLNVNINRNTWTGLPISINEGLMIDDNEYEYVPIGIFNVAEATYTAKGVQIVAYDNMARFDKTFPVNTTQGTAWQILRMICNDCGVQNGMTQAQIEALPNGNIILSLYSENDIETYRDLLSWLTQTLGCFAYIDRSGKLKLKQYESTVTDTLGTQHRFSGGKFNDFITKYTGISVVDIESKKTSYYAQTVDDGLTYNLGKNPFLQYGTDSVKNIMRRAVLNSLQDIYYSPFEISYSSLAAYDLGDVLQFPQGLGQNTKGCVMYSEWKFNKSTKIKGFGSNPALSSARSKTDKDISGLMSQIEKDGIQYYTYMNAADIDIADGYRVPVISLRFTTINTTKVTFQAEILVEADTNPEMECLVIYTQDGEELRYQPVETWRSGKHILSLWYVIEVEPNTLYRWQVYLEASGGSMHIDEECARGAIWGQGLVAVGTWDGYIDVEDTISAISLDSIGVDTFTAEAECEIITPHDIEVEDTITAVNLDSIEVDTFEAIMYVNKTSLIDEQITWGQLKDDESWADVKDNHTW